MSKQDLKAVISGVLPATKAVNCRVPTSSKINFDIPPSRLKLKTVVSPSTNPPRASSANPVAVINARWQQRGERLLHQACWCWGCDIKSASGNLLLEYGFEKHRAPDPAEGSSAYKLILSSEPSRHDDAPRKLNETAYDVSHNTIARFVFNPHPTDFQRDTPLAADAQAYLVLWGFGFYLAHPTHGAIFIHRYKFLPKFSRADHLTLPLWKLAQLPAMSVPHTLPDRRCAAHLLSEAVRFIACYERWVIARYGIEYRAASLKNAKARAFSPCEAIDEAEAIVAALQKSVTF